MNQSVIALHAGHFAIKKDLAFILALTKDRLESLVKGRFSMDTRTQAALNNPFFATS